MSQDDVRGECNQFCRVSTSVLGIACGPAIVDAHVAAVGPAQFLQPLHERREAGLTFRIARGQRMEHAYAPYPLALLRARGERPRRRSAAEQGDEVAPPHHSITSSARARSVAGTSMPSVFAVCRLMTNSNLVARNTGMSAGFSPFRMRPV